MHVHAGDWASRTRTRDWTNRELQRKLHRRHDGPRRLAYRQRRWQAVGKAFAQGLAKGAILGGTGDYAGATGDFASEGEPAVSTFHLFVPKK